MHAGIVSCPPDATCTELARMMSDHRVHSVAVADIGHGRPWGTWHMVSDMDLLAALAGGRDLAARELAGTDAAAISANEPVERAAQLMVDKSVSHLVVLHAEGGYPVGVLSTLDIAAAYARPQALGGPTR